MVDIIKPPKETTEAPPITPRISINKSDVSTGRDDYSSLKNDTSITTRVPPPPTTIIRESVDPTTNAANPYGLPPLPAAKSNEKPTTYINSKILTITLKDGTQGTYKGDLNNMGVPHGQGIFFGTDWKYNGAWENGNQHGQGTMTTETGTYVGSWENGEENGYGFLASTNGDVYNGTWENGEQNGYGVFISKDRDEYRGNWKNGKPDGHGTLSDKDEKIIYQGNWMDGEPQQEN